MENKNEDNNEDLEDTDSKKEPNIIYKVIIINSKTKFDELELVWKQIIGFSKDAQKKSLIIKNCDILSQKIRNELEENKLNPNLENHSILDFFRKKIIVEKIINYIVTCPDNREIFISYSSYFLNLLKFTEELIKDNKLLKKSIFQTTIHLFGELKKIN